LPGVRPEATTIPPSDNPSATDRLALAQLIAWVSQAPWGELTALNLPLARRAQRAYAASAADCTRRKCGYYPFCYLHGARRHAKSAHIVVTNHALLLRNSAAEGRILPPIRFWLVDEAHNIEAEARKQLTRVFDERELSATLRLLTGSRSLPARLLKSVTGLMATADQEKVEECAQTLRKELKQAVTLADTFFAYAQDLREYFGSERDNAYSTDEQQALNLWIGAELRESASWGALTNVGRTLYALLDATVKAGKDLQSWYSTGLAEAAAPSEFTDFGALLLDLEEQTETLALAISEPEENRVYSLHLSREWKGQSNALLEIAHLELGEQIAEEFLATTRSAIFTSATLAVGDSFKRFVSATGLATLPNERWETLQLSSSYDLAALMRLFVPNNLPEPNDASWLSELQAFLNSVHTTLGGGVLTLFTSRRDLVACRDALAESLAATGLDVLAQDGVLSNRTLQERFVADHTSSLFATKSFWEGFDAGGDTLRCVIIPKLPFGRPDVPLARERNAVYGRSAWARYDLPDAILELKQAVGRLIRSSSDVGCVILADTRLLTKNYARRVIDSLPVPPQCLSVAEILSQLA
jgi:ATP-dependent DNA helicase DinG